MRTTEGNEVDELVGRVRSWPAERRLALAQTILATLSDDLTARGQPRQSLRDLLGLVETRTPPPSDEECERIREEHRLRKYGR